MSVFILKKKTIMSMAATFISTLIAHVESQEHLASERIEETIRAKWQQAKLIKRNQM